MNHETTSTTGDAGIRVPSFSAYSLLELGDHLSGRVLFPGRDRLPAAGTAGYVRSQSRTALCSGEHHASMTLPLRDYPDDVLTPVDALVDEQPYQRDHIIISARNTLNEWGYQLRLQDRWWRRRGDAPIALEWPVVAISLEGIRLLPHTQAQALEADLITGMPLVIEGQSMSREFFVANCSDMAHVYEINPKGLLGPSRAEDSRQRHSENSEVWRKLSNAWQELKDLGAADEPVARQLEEKAHALGVLAGHNLMHSLLAQRHDGGLIAVAVTGALDKIATHLANYCSVRNAVLLDNGGSVGWLSLVKGGASPNLLISGPNYRPRGMVFLDLWPGGFLHPREHPLLARNDEGQR